MKNEDCRLKKIEDPNNITELIETLETARNRLKQLMIKLTNGAGQREGEARMIYRNRSEQRFKCQKN